MRISNELIAQIGLYYTAKGYRETTIRDMISDMLLFQKYCKKHNITSVEEIKHKIINEYTIYAAKSRTPKTSRYFGVNPYISKRTLQGRILAIKNFLKYCNFVFEIGIDFSKIELPKCPIPKMKYLTELEVEALFDYIWQYPEPREMMLRNYLFMKLAYTSGMRLSELLAIRYEDILKPGYEITIVGKGDKIRPIYFTQEIKNLTEEYVSYRTKRPPTSLWSGHTRKLQGTGELLFIRHDDYGFGKGLSKSTIAGMFKKYSEGLGLGKKITCHMLRHSYGTTLMRKGVNIRLVQELLGHSSIMSTQRYTHVTNRDMLMAHQTVFF